MPPKFKVTKDEVLDTAYTLLETRGRSAVTSRAIADALGISSRPIYSFFPSMESLFEALYAKAIGLKTEYMNRQYTTDPFLNTGVGFILFSLEKRNVSDFLDQYWTNPASLALDTGMIDGLFGKLQHIPGYTGISREAFLEIYQNVSIFTYGLVAYARANKTDLSEAETIQRLKKAGEAFIVQHLWHLDKQIRK